jgi:hypothetical protein
MQCKRLVASKSPQIYFSWYEEMLGASKLPNAPESDDMSEFLVVPRLPVVMSIDLSNSAMAVDAMV